MAFSIVLMSFLNRSEETTTRDFLWPYPFAVMEWDEQPPPCAAAHDR